MDQDLPVKDFCPLHLASLAQAGTLSEDKPARQGARKTLWLTLLASLLVHAILLTLWTPQPKDVKSIAPAPNLRITVSTAVTDTATAETAPEHESPAVEEPITSGLPPPPENTTMAATENVTREKPRIDLHALEIPSHPLPATSESSTGNVFHPGLRRQIRDARTRRERLRNTGKSELHSWQDASGRTWVDLGDGRCMRSAGDTWGATGWELPSRCKDQLTEGESLLRSMQERLDSQ
jgi:hypothetical protein